MDYKPISVPILEQNVKLNAEKGELLEDVTVYKDIVTSDYHQTRFELCCGVSESLYAGIDEAMLGCN